MPRVARYVVLGGATDGLRRLHGLLPLLSCGRNNAGRRWVRSRHDIQEFMAGRGLGLHVGRGRGCGRVNELWRDVCVRHERVLGEMVCVCVV